jgi:hypothetical protein
MEYLLLRSPTTENSIKTVTTLAVVHHRCVVPHLRWILTGPEPTVNSDVVSGRGEDRGSEDGLRITKRPVLVVSRALHKRLRQVYRYLLNWRPAVEQKLTRRRLLWRGGERREEVSIGRGEAVR